MTETRYTIQQAADRLGVHPNTLRNLEIRGEIEPVPRDRNGYRRYTDTLLEQIEHLLFPAKAS